MFNLAKKHKQRQLKRALVLQNGIMVTIFGRQCEVFGIEPGSSNDLAGVIGVAINHAFGKRGEKSNFSKAEIDVYSHVCSYITSDNDLHKLIFRVLFDIYSLGESLKDRAILSEFPDIVKVLTEGKKLYPDIFEDWQEVQFRALAERFADKYDPGMKGPLLKMFPK